MTAWSSLVVLAAVAVGAFAKGVTGVGLPAVAVPVMAAFVGVEHAVVVMAIPGVISNAWLVWQHRAQAGSTRDLRTLLPTGVAGVVVGTWVLTRMDERLLSLGLATAVAVYLTVYLTRPGFALPPRLTRVLSPGVGLASGALQGATGISGPLVVTYLHGFRLRQHVYVFSVAAIFLTFAVAQGLAVAHAGLYTWTRLVHSLLALVPTLLLLPAGMRLSRRLDGRVFELLVLGLLVVMGVKLVVDAIYGV